MSEQLIGKDGKSFAGNVHRKVNTSLLESVTPVALSLNHRLKSIDSNVTGIVMCDYIEDRDGKVTAIDPGLRPSGNTAASMINLLLKQHNCEFYVKNAVSFKVEAGTTYSTIAEKLGDLSNLKSIIETGEGALPWGYNQIDGKGLFIIVSPTEQGYLSVKEKIDSRLLISDNEMAA